VRIVNNGYINAIAAKRIHHAVELLLRFFINIILCSIPVLKSIAAGGFLVKPKVYRPDH
jgi:hypothetical protein